MSTEGKRMIFVSQCTPDAVEGVCLGAAIKPGTLVKQGATGINTDTDAATVFGKIPLVANKNYLVYASVDTAWTQNENMVAIQPRSGELLHVLVAAAQAITARGVGLSANADGTLKIAATDGTEEILFTAEEIITTGASAELVLVRRR